MNELLKFAITWALIVLIPGPDMVFVLTESVKHGVKSGLKIAAGLCSGLFFHSFVVLSGLGVIISKKPLIVEVMKYIGLCYLIYIAVSGLIKAFSDKATTNLENIEDDDVATNLELGYNPYKRGVIMNVTNPKLMIFFLSLLPQFINIEDNTILQSAMFVVVLVGVAFAVFAVVSLFCAKLSVYFKSKKANSSTLNKVFAVVETIIYTAIAVSVF